MYVHYSVVFIQYSLFNEYYCSAGSQYIAAGYTLAVLYYRLPLSPTDAEDDEHLVCNDPRETEKDLNAAMDVLHKNAAEYRVNPNQIVFSGFSAGGHLAALHSARCSRRGSCPKAQVLHYPYLDAGAMIFCSEVGTKYREQMDFNDCHPTYLVDRGVPPTIVYHAKQDELVQTRQMTDYVTALMNHNVPHEYYEAPSGGHYLVSFDEVTTGGSFTATANYASLIEHALAIPDAQCNRCTDNPSQALYDEGLVCNSPEIVSRVESACSAPHWNRRGYCRQTCFNLGKAYDGEVCCDSAVVAVEPSVEKEEVAPNSPAVSSNTMCTPCYDNLSQEMIQNHLTCADSEEDIQTKCRDDEYWTLNRLCQATCYLVGRGYDGDECCEAISM